MGKQVKKWIADDETMFDDERSMVLHELKLIDQKEIDLFLINKEVSVKRKAEYTKLLREWQEHKRELQELPKNIETPVDEIGLQDERLAAFMQQQEELGKEWVPAGGAALVNNVAEDVATKEARELEELEESFRKAQKL